MGAAHLVARTAVILSPWPLPPRPAADGREGQNRDMSDLTTAGDRCRGVLVGLAAGDQIGGPIRMAVRLAESLLDCGGFDPSDILGRYLAGVEGSFPPPGQEIGRAHV